MIAIETSCNPEKLRKVMAVSRLTMQGFYGLTREDKEDILLDVIYRFEMDNARFPVSVYARHCRNKVIGFLAKKTAQKRMAQMVVDGVRVYLEDLSLNLLVGEDEDSELETLISNNSTEMDVVDLVASIEQNAPELAPLVVRVIDGGELTKKERAYLKKNLKKEMFI